MLNRKQHDTHTILNLVGNNMDCSAQPPLSWLISWFGICWLFSVNRDGLAMKNLTSSFIHYLDEWSTETFPDVLVNYVFWEGDKSVGEPDSFEISVIRDKKDIWDLLNPTEQDEIEQYCEVDMKRTIEEWNQP
jgi:hypothetical protein